MAFIGDSRLLVVEQMRSPQVVEEAPKLALFDTFGPGKLSRCTSTPDAVCVRVRMVAEVRYNNFSRVIGQDRPFYPNSSQRTLVLLFCLRGDASNKIQGTYVDRSETHFRLTEEIGEGGR